MASLTTIGIIVFEDFETLDVFGPVQMWGHSPGCRLTLVSADGKPVRSSQGVTVQADHAFPEAPTLDVVMMPGGLGTRRLVKDEALLAFLRQCDRSTQWTTSVCTGAALLAQAGLLRGRRATTNKRASDWVRGMNGDVDWQSHARFVQDGKYMTSSGVSAGMDMALALIERLHGRDVAEAIARDAEYVWNSDPDNDPFATGAS